MGTEDQWDNIFQTFNKFFDFKNIPEKVFELNPRMTTDKMLDLLISWKFTNLTFGLQSTNNDVLEFNNRQSLPFNEFASMIKKSSDLGIKCNVDVMTAIYKNNLDEDIDILLQDVQKLIDMNVSALKNPSP